MFSENDDLDRYRTRFGGFALETLQGLVELGHAAYDDDRHCWAVSGKATSDGKPFEVPDVDWHAADAARRAAATPPGRRPLRWARAISPHVAVGLDDSLTLVLQVPADATRLTISDSDALKAVVDEARQIRDRIEGRYDTSRHSLPRGATDDQPRT